MLLLVPLLSSSQLGLVSCDCLMLVMGGAPAAALPAGVHAWKLVNVVAEQDQVAWHTDGVHDPAASQKHCMYAHMMYSYWGDDAMTMNTF